MFKALRSKKEDGFTLIELLIVIVIIGILAAIGTTAYLAQSAKAKDVAAKQNVSQVAEAINTGVADGSLSFLSAEGAAPTGSESAQQSGTQVYNTAGATPIATTTKVFIGTGADWCVSGVDGTGTKYAESNTTALFTSTTAVCASGVVTP